MKPIIMEEFLKERQGFIRIDCFRGIWLFKKMGKRPYVRWHSNGQQREHSYWVDNRRTTDVKEWDINGKLLKRHYEYSPRYKYKTYSEMIDDILYIRLGCFLLSFKEWEEDFYNNPREFPKGAKKTKARERVYLAHCRYWGKKSFLEEER